jgi:hypothetical protein
MIIVNKKWRRFPGVLKYDPGRQIKKAAFAAFFQAFPLLPKSLSITLPLDHG